MTFFTTTSVTLLSVSRPGGQPIANRTHKIIMGSRQTFLDRSIQNSGSLERMVSLLLTVRSHVYEVLSQPINVSKMHGK